MTQSVIISPRNMHNSPHWSQLILFSYCIVILEYTITKISGFDAELHLGDQFCISD